MLKTESIFADTATYVGELVREMKVDYEAFRIRLRPCEMSVCRGTCCHDGVRLSQGDAERIDALCADDPALPSAAIERLNGGYKTATRPANADELASDYPAHFPPTRCVFLDESSFCALQKKAIAEGEHPWKYKPLTCWLHPLVIDSSGDRPMLTLYRKGNDPQKEEGYPGFASCTHCGREDDFGIPAHEALMAELVELGRLGGRDLYAEIAQ